jgi:hypothetical protein
MARDGHGLPKVSNGPAISTLLCPAGGPSLKRPCGCFRGGPPTNRVAWCHLLPPWIPHAVRLCFQLTQRPTTAKAKAWIMKLNEIFPSCPRQSPSHGATRSSFYEKKLSDLQDLTLTLISASCWRPPPSVLFDRSTATHKTVTDYVCYRLVFLIINVGYVSELTQLKS